MSGFAGAFGPKLEPSSDLIRSMLRAMPVRGDADQSAVWASGSSALGVSRLDWELGDDFSGPIHLLNEWGLVLAADARLTYRADLRRKLAQQGVTPTGETSSHLILAAYSAWGAECPRELEGEFSFVLWDSEKGQVVCARDFLGRRPFFYADLGGSLIVGSSVGAVLAHPRCSRELNLVNLASVAAGLLWSSGSDTAYKVIRVLPTASTMVWSAGVLGQPVRHWTPPIRDGSTPSSTDDAAEELRHLLAGAITERLALEGATTTWMSGGWDSTAIFGVGKSALRADTGGRDLLPVSISYPEGDPGREDEIISEVAGFWDTPVHWLDIDEIPLLDTLQARAATSDEPPAHLYEPWNRALARGTRACHSRVAFDGCGGDNLFQVSDIFLADLLGRGSLRQLVRELRARRRPNLAHLLTCAVEPLLPRSVSRVTRALLRKTPREHYLERPMAPWIRPDFAAGHQLAERDRAFLPVARAGDFADAENRAYITLPVWSAVLSYMSGRLLEEGVEARSPLLDCRLIEFALRRPVSERSAGAETKILLRRAAAGLLPPSVLAPRTRRTGLTVGYSRREMRRHYPALFGELFQSSLLLAELGVVDPLALRRSVDEFMSQGDELVRVGLFHALKTELWLRAHLGAGEGKEPLVAALAADSSQSSTRGSNTVRPAAATRAGPEPALL